MARKAKLNAIVDTVMPVAFIAATVAGFILMTTAHCGYRGGRNPAFDQTVLFLARDRWNDVHTLGSLAMIVGILIHLVLQWRWILGMARKFVRSRGPAPVSPGGPEPCKVVVTSGRG